MIASSTQGNGWLLRLHSRPFDSPRGIASFAKQYTNFQFVPKRPVGFLPTTVWQGHSADEGHPVKAGAKGEEDEEGESKTSDVPSMRTSAPNASAAYALVSTCPPIKIMASYEATTADM